MKPRVLVACEYSGVVREAFARKGFEAWSCDILPTDIPGNHYQCDVRDVITQSWDLLIAHPPCTYLTVTGNKWFKPEYRDRFPTREQDRKEAIEFFMLFADADVEHVCIENPVGIMSTLWRKPNQIIQPYQFGHSEAKKTCLWLKNLPELTPTKIVEPEYITFKSGKRMAKWYSDAVGLPKHERMKLRSKTFQGIADAMANQWSGVIMHSIERN